MLLSTTINDNYNNAILDSAENLLPILLQQFERKNFYHLLNNPNHASSAK